MNAIIPADPSLDGAAVPASSDTPGSSTGARATPRSGTLFVVATPIGNLGDLSPRAAELLARVPMIAAEDTRTSRTLVPTRAEPPTWVALHDHNESRALEPILDRLRAGDDVALVSDAGTPLVSDPGYRLVAAAHDAGIDVLPVPGPCAAVAALSASGLASDRFAFEGFLPAKAGARRKRLEALADSPHTLIFYVPARDLVAVLDAMAEAFGASRPACVGRELTKQFETVRRDGLAALSAWTAADPDRQRGEAVVLVEGVPDRAPAATGPIPATALADALADELPPARAAKVIRSLTGLSRAEAFALVESRRGAR